MAFDVLYRRVGLDLIMTTMFLTALIRTSLQATEDLEKDIQALAKSLPGCYSNVKQYYAHALTRFPPARRHLLLRAEFYKMEHPLFNDSLTIYFQHFTKSSSKAFSSGFYSFVADKQIKVIRMRIYKFRPGVFEIKKPFHNYLIPSQSVSGLVLKKRSQNKVLLTHSSCDMYWTKVSDLRFIGITGSQCLASLGKSNIRISVSMTVGDSKLKLTEGWYNVKDGTRLTQVNVPYLLRKKSHPPKPGPSKPDDTKLERLYKDQQMYNTIDVPEYSNAQPPEETIRWKAKEPIAKARKLPTTRAPSLSKKKSFPRRQVRTYTKKKKSCKERPIKTHRVLRNFRHVVAALTAGHDVTFRVDINGCTTPEQLRIDRVSFGGKVADFIYVKEKRSNKRKDRVYFSTMKTAMGYAGMEHITREITLHRGGRVEVKVTKEYTEGSRLPLKYNFQCRLYNDRKGRGSVRLMSNPASSMKRVSVVEKMMALLGQGHDLRLIADMTRCHGSRSHSPTIIGSSITDYDIVNDGKTMEVFLPVDEAVSPSFRSGKRNGYLAQIFKGGDIILTWLSGRKDDNGFQKGLRMSSAYHCKMSSKNQIVTNENEASSISVYYHK